MTNKYYKIIYKIYTSYIIHPMVESYDKSNSYLNKNLKDITWEAQNI